MQPVSARSAAVLVEWLVSVQSSAVSFAWPVSVELPPLSAPKPVSVELEVGPVARSVWAPSLAAMFGLPVSVVPAAGPVELGAVWVELAAQTRRPVGWGSTEKA